MEIGAHRFLHRLDEIHALLLQRVEVHRRCDRAKAVDEFRLDQDAQCLGVIGAAAERLGGKRDRGGVRLHTHIEFGADIDPHAVLGDERIAFAAADFEAQRLQVYPGDRVEDRQDDRAAVEHDFLTAETGADIGLVTAGARVKRGENKADAEDQNDANAGR